MSLHELLFLADVAALLVNFDVEATSVSDTPILATMA